MVSPGAANEGVTPIFREKIDHLFSHHHLSVFQFCSVTRIYFLLKN